MSKHTADTATAVISPKVKSAGVWGAAATGALVVVAAFLQSVPREALEQLGPWAGPVGAAIATAAAVFAAYAKGDPLRSLGGAVADMGEAYVPAPEADPAPAELFAEVAVSIDVDDTLTPEADALAARAAQLRRTGSTAGDVL